MSDEDGRRIDAVLHAPEQSWWDGPLRFLADPVESGGRERAAVQARLDHAVTHLDDVGERDTRAGLFTPALLRRWTAGLPVGLVLLRVRTRHRARRYGLRAEQAVVTGVVRAVTGLLTRSDRVVQIAPEDLLLVLPSWPAGHVQMLYDEVCGRIGRLEQQHSFVLLPAAGAASITCERSFPWPDW